MPPPTSVPPLAIIMPNPPLTRRRSTLLSRAPSPRTPSMRSPIQHPLHLPPTDNRKSSDSWNSSNYDLADDPDLEWKSEHVLLLTRVSFYSSQFIIFHSLITIFRHSTLFQHTYSPLSLALFLLPTFSTRLPVVSLRPRVQTNGLTLCVRLVANLLNFAVLVLKRSLPSKSGIPLLKRRIWTRISNTLERSSNTQQTLSAPSTANPVWTLCSLPSLSYVAQTRSPGRSLLLLSPLFFKECLFSHLSLMQSVSPPSPLRSLNPQPRISPLYSPIFCGLPHSQHLNTVFHYFAFFPVSRI